MRMRVWERDEHRSIQCCSRLWNLRELKGGLNVILTHVPYLDLRLVFDIFQWKSFLFKLKNLYFKNNGSKLQTFSLCPPVAHGVGARSLGKCFRTFPPAACRAGIFSEEGKFSATHSILRPDDARRMLLANSRAKVWFSSAVTVDRVGLEQVEQFLLFSR